MTTDIAILLQTRPSDGGTALQNWNGTLVDSFRRLPVKTVNDVLATANRPERTLASLAKLNGEGTVRAFLSLVIIDFSKFFSLDRSLDRIQVEQLILDIMQDYWYLTIEDFKVFFANCRRGDYGTVYNRLDGFVILEWLGKYAEERSAQAELLSLQQAASSSPRDRFTRMSQSARAEKIFEQAVGKVKFTQRRQ